MLSNHFEAPAIGFMNSKWAIPAHYVQCFNNKTFIIDYINFDTSVSMFMGQVLGRMISKYSFSALDKAIGGYNLSRFIHDLCDEIKDEKVKVTLVKEFIEFLSSNYPNVARLLGTNKDKEPVDYFKLFYETCLYNDFLCYNEPVSVETRNEYKQFIVDYTGAEYFDKKYDDHKKEEANKNSYNYGYGSYNYGSYSPYGSSYGSCSPYGSSYSPSYSTPYNQYKKPVMEPFVPVGSANEKNTIIKALEFLCDHWPSLWNNYEEIVNSNAYRCPYGQHGSYSSYGNYGSYNGYSSSYNSYGSYGSSYNNYSTRLARNVGKDDGKDDGKDIYRNVPTNTAPRSDKKVRYNNSTYLYSPTIDTDVDLFTDSSTVPATSVDSSADPANTTVTRYIGDTYSAGNIDYGNKSRKNGNGYKNNKHKKDPNAPRGG